MQEVRPDVELLDGLQGDARHESVKAGVEEIVQCLSQALLGELC